MIILNDTAHLIIIVIKTNEHSTRFKANEKAVIIALDLFNFKIVLIKMLDSADEITINNSIKEFYSLYTINYEFLSDLKKDLTKTSVLFLNFNESILTPFNKAEEWWNDKNELRGLEAINLIDNSKVLNEKPNELIKISNKIAWGDIPHYIRYNVFLYLFHIIPKLLKNKDTEIDYTKFVK